MPLLKILIIFMLCAYSILGAPAHPDRQTQPAPTLRYAPLSANTSTKVSRTTEDDTVVWCESSIYFDNQTSPSAPLAEDCQQMMLNIAGPAQWLFTGAIWHQLIEYKTCAFAVYQPDMWSTTRIGNGDVITLITTSMHLWQKDGHLGGAGMAICELYYPEIEGPYVPRLVYFDIFPNGAKPWIDEPDDDNDGNNGRDSGNKANLQFDHNSTFVDSHNVTPISNHNSTFINDFNSTLLNITLGN